MPRVMLQPRGTAARRGPQNFAKSVRDGLPLAVLAGLPPHELEALTRVASAGRVRLWGNTATDDPGRKKGRAIAERRAGDVVLFTADGRIFAAATIAHTLHNAQVAREIWDLDEKGRPWEHMFALTDLRELDVETSTALTPLGMDATVREVTLLSQSDSDRLAVLAGLGPLGPTDLPSEAADGAATLLRSLVGVPLATVTGSPNMILGVGGGAVYVATESSPAGEPVPIEAVQVGLDELANAGEVRVHPDVLGYRSAFVGAVLLAIPGTEALTNPARVRLVPTTADTLTTAAPDFAVLDGVAQVRIRREQAGLRRLLIGAAREAECALCRRLFPTELLVAAHVKRRSICSDSERRDLRNIAMLACKFGCDELYETGYVAVTADGIIKVATSVGSSSALRSYLDRLEGERCSAHDVHSAGYFAWHEANVYRN